MKLHHNMLWLGVASSETVLFQAASSEEAQIRAMLSARLVRVVPNPYAVARALGVQDDRFVLALWRAVQADRAGTLRTVRAGRKDGER